jgi:hypothetical protein
MDIWSLFVTIIAMYPMFAFLPKDRSTYRDILSTIRAAVVKIPKLSAIARENPTYRASAAQLLVAHFHGQGLTTSRAVVPLITPQREEAEPDGIQAAASVPVLQAPVQAPLVVYPLNRRHRRIQDAGPGNVPKAPARPQKTHQDGIVKPRAASTKSPRQKLAAHQGLEREQLNKVLKREELKMR